MIKLLGIKVLTELHGGRLDIVNQLGLGATVTLSLPRAESTSAAIVPFSRAAS